MSAHQAIELGLSLAREIKNRHAKGMVLAYLDPDHIQWDGASATILENAPALSPYSAPEQLAGSQPDERSDIFSFGAVLLHMATGQAPFGGQTPEEWKAAQTAREASLPDGVPPGLARVLNRCLEMAPNQRYQTTRALAVELKLLASELRRSRAAIDLHKRLFAIEAQLAALTAGQTAHKTEHDGATSAFRQSLEDLAARTKDHAAERAAASAAIDSIQDTLRDIELKVEAQRCAITSIESSLAQTDEVIEHMVDTFDLVNRPALEPEASVGAAPPETE